MARTALWAPAHRVMQRLPIGSGGGPANAAPSLDMAGVGIQDSRLLWNSANSSTGAQVVGWYMSGPHPVIDQVPSALTTTAIAAAQVPTAGVALTLVSSTGAGITVMSSALLALPSLNTIAAGTLAIDSVPTYISFGASDFTVFYNAGTAVARNIQVRSVGDDSGATFTVVGYDLYGYPMTETITGSSGAPGTATGKKAFKFVTSVTPAGTLSGSNVSIGQGDTFGMPIFLGSTTGLMGFWNNLIITGAGTATAGVTTTPSATTGDVRGTYLVGSASDASKRLQVYQHPSVSSMQSLGINVGLFGKTQA